MDPRWERGRGVLNVAAERGVVKLAWWRWRLIAMLRICAGAS